MYQCEAENQSRAEVNCVCVCDPIPREWITFFDDMFSFLFFPILIVSHLNRILLLFSHIYCTYFIILHLFLTWATDQEHVLYDILESQARRVETGLQLSIIIYVLLE